MHIKDIYKKENVVVSFEVFPPKREDNFASVVETSQQLAELKPSFISVTYGAAGEQTSTDFTIRLASAIKNEYNTEALVHLTCINSTIKQIEENVNKIKSEGLENILALRGDRVNNNTNEDFKYAKDLVRILKAKDICIGAACHPEGHLETKNEVLNYLYLKEKVEQGVDFLVSQLFFDNSKFFTFYENLRDLGIDIPISAGIMPVINTRQIRKITNLCGAKVPAKFERIMNKYQDNKIALRDDGIAFATEQIIDLLSYGVEGIHLYVMNRTDVAKKLFDNINSIVKELKVKE
jgi:methylenetetrahydrofolate reductase (NADPH)